MRTKQKSKVSQLCSYMQFLGAYRSNKWTLLVLKQLPSANIQSKKFVDHLFSVVLSYFVMNQKPRKFINRFNH